MKWLALLLLGGVAHAAPITPPAGWTLDPSLQAPPAATRFGGATTKVSVWAYRAAAPGAVLYVNRAEAELPAADRDKLATIELEEPRNALRRQGAAKVEQDSQRYDASAKQLEAQVTWRDAAVIDASRVLVAADDKRTVALTAQCVLAIDAPPELAQACQAALATMDTEVPAASRLPLAIVATVAESPQLPAPATLGDGGPSKLPPIIVGAPPKQERDMRPVYLGAGLVILAGLAYWNRRRREKFETDHPAPPRRRRQRDEDADALHAAAEAGDDEDKK